MAGRDAENGSRPKTQPLSRSVEREGTIDEGDDDEEEVLEEEVAHVGDADAAACMGAIVVRKRAPRRPTGRMQRFVLAGPGTMQVVEARGSPVSTKRSEAFMTHLPDSPPRGFPRNEERGTIFSFDGTDCVEKDPEEHDESSSEAIAEQDEQIDGREDENEADQEQDEDEQRPEVDESTDTMSDGPTEVDIAKDDDPAPPLTTYEVEGSMSDLDFDLSSEESEDDEAEYKHLLEARIRLEQEQHERDQLRHELETYMRTLEAKCDADGEKLVEFPRNFQQIVSLMTVHDIANECTPEVATSPKTKPMPGSSVEKHKSWFQVLIQNSLSKQQAFGILDELEDCTDGQSELDAKLALKMARIRQLDAILEEKLGKNLYAAVNYPPKGAKISTKSSTTKKLDEVNLPSTKRRGSDAQPIGVDFIERNKKEIENGAKKKLTREEEDRIKLLMKGNKKDEALEGDPASPDELKCGEFKLDPHQKEDIEKLLAEKRGAYTSAVLMALEDEVAEVEDRPDAPTKGPRTCKPNIVQETKKDRLRRQKLQRIDEELKFLHDNESVPILPDEDEDDDGCRSERSYMTVTSTLSTCSTRSGVTRRQLDQFVASELSKPECTGEKAPSEEIKQLLRSLSHISTATPRPATVTV